MGGIKKYMWARRRTPGPEGTDKVALPFGEFGQQRTHREVKSDGHGQNYRAGLCQTACSPPQPRFTAARCIREFRRRAPVVDVNYDGVEFYRQGRFVGRVGGDCREPGAPLLTVGSCPEKNHHA